MNSLIAIIRDEHCHLFLKNKNKTIAAYSCVSNIDSLDNFFKKNKKFASVHCLIVPKGDVLVLDTPIQADNNKELLDFVSNDPQISSNDLIGVFCDRSVSIFGANLSNFGINALLFLKKKFKYLKIFDYYSVILFIFIEYMKCIKGVENDFHIIIAFDLLNVGLIGFSDGIPCFISSHNVKTDIEFYELISSLVANNDGNCFLVANKGILELCADYDFKRRVERIDIGDVFLKMCTDHEKDSSDISKIDLMYKIIPLCNNKDSVVKGVEYYLCDEIRVVFLNKNRNIDKIFDYASVLLIIFSMIFSYGFFLKKYQIDLLMKDKVEISRKIKVAKEEIINIENSLSYFQKVNLGLSALSSDLHCNPIDIGYQIKDAVLKIKNAHLESFKWTKYDCINDHIEFIVRIVGKRASEPLKVLESFDSIVEELVKFHKSNFNLTNVEYKSDSEVILYISN